MKRALLAVSGLVVLVACSSTTTTTSGSSSGGSSGNGSSSGSSGSEAPPASTTSATVDVDSSCPAFTPCGGNPSGTYDYTGGCVDVFASVRGMCSGIDASGVKVTLKGSIYFLAGNALKRDVTIDVSGTVLFPASCVANVCTAAEQGLQSTFPGATCTQAGTNCSCTIQKSTTNTNSTTFTVSGNTVTTNDGETYEICDQDGTLQYSGKSAGAEKGSWTLAKRE